jgi:hypothetical protein
MRTRGALKIDKTGINEALALPLFCKEHDNYVFEYIETCEEIVEDYMTALLFSYRSLCAEIRKKIYNHFFTLRLYNYEPLQEYLDERAKDYLFRCSEIDETAILNDLDPIKDYLEGEILKLYTGKEFGYGLNIHYQRYNRIDVCVSTLMSYFINNDQSTFDIPGCLFINILPFKDYTLKITCIHDLFSNNEVETEFDIWNNLNQDEFNKKVTMTILKNAETWAMSPTFYYRLPIEKKKMIIDEWNKTIDPRIESGKFEANLFDINGIT